MKMLKWVGILLFSIFGLLGVVTIVGVCWYSPDGRMFIPLKKTEADFNNFQIALSAYKNDFGRFPTANEGLNILLVDSKTEKGYMEKLLLDFEGNQYKYSVVDGVPIIWTNSTINHYGFSASYWVKDSKN